MTKRHLLILLITMAVCFLLVVCYENNERKNAQIVRFSAEQDIEQNIAEPTTWEIPVMRFTPEEADALLLRLQTEREEAKKAAEEAEKASRYLGRFLCTSYCPCYACSEGYGNMTSTGVRARAGHTIAVDPRVIPYGTWVLINGKAYRAEDCGGGVKGNHIDVYFDTHAESMRWHMGYYDVYLLP